MKSRLLALILLSGLAQAYNLYLADLHSHTGYSDGVSTPRHAFAYARDTARIDVLAVTDHCSGLLSDSLRWPDAKAQADAATIAGRFVGIAGFEWSHCQLGHANVLFADSLTSEGACATMGSFYGWLQSQPMATGQFNHPVPGNYDAFAYSDTGDAAMALFEVRDPSQVDCYHVALDRGWRVAACANQDNHAADWGAGSCLTGIWADSLTSGSIHSALTRMRTFGTADRGLALRLFANGCWMGSTVENGAIRFRVEVTATDTVGRSGRLAIVTNGGVVIDSIATGHLGTAVWECSTATGRGERRYFYCRASENNGNWALTSPVWTSDPAPLPAGADHDRSDLSIVPNPFRAAAVARGHETETFVVYDAAGSVAERCRGQRVGVDLAPGVYFVRGAIPTKSLRLVKSE